MKLLHIASVTFLLAWNSVAAAQQPRLPKSNQPSLSSPTLSAPQVTPELWIYSQELRRHDDPALAVRRKAEIKADQRLSRLAALKWYGLSNARPEACPVPYMSTYSAAWIGNGSSRYDWAAVGTVSLTAPRETYDVRR